MADLTTASAVKAYLGLTGTELDSLLSALVSRASAAIENYLQGSVKSASHVQNCHGHGGTAMLLKNWPVQSVQSVVVDGQAIPPASAWGEPGWWLSDRSVLLFGYRFARGHANVVIGYTAGWDTVPADIEQACIETVALAFKRREHIDVSSKALAGESISFITAELTPSAKQALLSYRRVAPL